MKETYSPLHYRPSHYRLQDHDPLHYLQDQGSEVTVSGIFQGIFLTLGYILRLVIAICVVASVLALPFLLIWSWGVGEGAIFALQVCATVVLVAIMIAPFAGY